MENPLCRQRIPVTNDSAPSYVRAGLIEALREDAGDDSAPIGLEDSIDRLVTGIDGPIVGVVGFSQGGAMAAQVADVLGARWAILFSPIYAACHPAQCTCPTLVAFDRADPVMPATETLLGELSTDVVLAEHHEGHRLPAEVMWYEQGRVFLLAQSVD